MKNRIILSFLFLCLFNCLTIFAKTPSLYSECLRIEDLRVEAKNDMRNQNGANYNMSDKSDLVESWNRLVSLCKAERYKEVVDYYDAHKMNLLAYFRFTFISYDFVNQVYIPACDIGYHKEYNAKAIKELEWQQDYTEMTMAVGNDQGNNYVPMHYEDLLFNLFGFYMSGKLWKKAIGQGNKLLTFIKESYGPNDFLNGTSLYNLAWAYYKSGDTVNAVQSMKKAIAIYTEAIKAKDADAPIQRIQKELKQAEGDLANWKR